MFKNNLITNKLDRLYLSRPISFIDNIKEFNEPPPIFEGAMMVPMFKYELLEDPGKLPKFFKHYGDFLERALNIQGKEQIIEISSQDLGGFSILSDHDLTGQLTLDVIKAGSKPLLRVYDDVSAYGPVMNIFSDFMGCRGKHLKTLLMGRNFSC